MDSLFIIPTLISPEVDDKIVPSVCKLVERSILLQHASLLRKAAIMRFLGKGKGLNTESTEILDRLESLVELSEEEKEEDEKTKKNKRQKLDKQERKRQYNQSGIADDPSKYDPKPVYGDKEKPEVPKGISFYSAVSLEPTYLEIPLIGRPDAASGDEVTRVLRVGVKSVPYKLDGIRDLKTYLYKVKNRSISSTKFMRKMSRLKKFISGWDSDYKKRPFQFLRLAPTAKELQNVKFLSRSLGTGVVSLWAPTTIFSHYDFRDAELKENLWTYDQLVRGGWGNIVIIDDDSQVVYFCMQDIKACHQLTFTYLKKILDMEDVINVSGTVSRSAKPMSPGRSVGPSSIFASIQECKNDEDLKSTLNELHSLIGS